MNSRWLIALLVVFASGCTQQRGRFSMVSSRVLRHQYVAVHYPRVMGEACFSLMSSGKDGLQLAVADALAKQPGANALVLVKFHVKDAKCFVVEGTPVQLKQ